MDERILHEESVEEFKRQIARVFDMGTAFKTQDRVTGRAVDDAAAARILCDLDEEGIALDEILDEFETNILPYCTNFGSKKFLGFPDAGNSTAAIAGDVLSSFMQQNLINQSFCAPSATFVEIAVIQWLRDAIGYPATGATNIWDVGGVVTTGGTGSNAIGMMLAREHRQQGTLEKGVRDPEAFKLVVPKGIGHYSVKSAQMWLGCGNNLLEVETDGYRYNLSELARTIRAHKGRIMALVAYAGDSRTMSVDRLDEIAKLVRSIDPTIWLHVDACHGFSLGFSESLRYKIQGIESFDSVSTDPHKVMLTPYTLSVLLVRNPKDMKKVTSMSDLIMQERFAFGQVTPFLGSKSWMSLKLWFMMKHFGKRGLDRLITQRHELAKYLEAQLRADPEFTVLNRVDINSVAFFYTGNRPMGVRSLNTLNQRIHAKLLSEGDYHLHQFSIPDHGHFQADEIVYPLRFMCGNPAVGCEDVDGLIAYVRSAGRRMLADDGNGI